MVNLTLTMTLTFLSLEFRDTFGSWFTVHGISGSWFMING